MANEDVFQKFTAPATQQTTPEPAEGQTPEPAQQATEPAQEPVKEPEKPVEPTKEPEAEPAEGQTPEPAQELEKPQESEKPEETPEYLTKVKELLSGITEINSEDDIKTFVDNYKKLQETSSENEDKAKRFEMTEKWIKDNAPQLDPVKRAGGEENYRKNELAKALAGGRLDRLAIANDIVNMDWDKSSDFDILRAATRLKSPNLSDENALKVALMEMNLDISEVGDWSKAQEFLSTDDMAMITYHASQKRDALQDQMGKIEIPEPLDIIKELEKQQTEFQNQVAEVKDKWDEARTSIKSSFQKIRPYEDEDFEFEIPDGDRNLLDTYVDRLIARGEEPNEANKQRALQAAINDYELKNKSKIKAAYRTWLLEKEKAEWVKERDNQTPLETSAPGPQADENPQQSTWRSNLGLKSKESVKT